MANFARGLAAGLESGYKLGEMLRQKNERERLQEIMQAAPQTLQGYGPEQATQLQAIQNASYVNEAGERVPYYNVSATPSDNGLGGYEVRPNLKATYKGEDGEAKPYFGGLGYESTTGLTTPQRFAPGPVTSFLGQRYGAGGPTQQQMEQARYKSMADVLAETNPAEGLRMRQQMLAEQRAAGAEQRAAGAEERAIAGEKRAAELFPGQLEAQKTQTEAGKLGLEDLKQTREQKNFLKEVNKDYSAFMKTRLGDRTSPNTEDTIAGLQYRAGKLAEKGLVDESLAATQQHISLANQRIELQTRERAAEIPRVISALAAGDTSAAEEFYRKFVPDGANVKDIKRERDGSYTIMRETLAGEKLPPTKLKSLSELDAAIRTFADPKALSDFTQREIENTFRNKTLSIQESESRATAANRAEALKIQKLGLEKPTAASIVPFLNKKTGETVLVDITGLPRVNGVIQTPEGLTAVKGRDTSISKKDEEIYEGLKKTTKWTSAKTRDEKARLLKLEGLDPSLFGFEGNPDVYRDVE